jgi:hypothetical protein
MSEPTYSDYLPLRKGVAPSADTHASGVRVYADADGALRSIQSDGMDAAVGGSLPWAAFDSVAGDEQVDGHQGFLGFQQSFIGPGTLSSVTFTPDFGGTPNNPAIVVPDVGCYLVTANVQPVDGDFGASGDATELGVEIQVFNSESDPFMYLYPNTVPHILAGVLTAVCNVISSDDPATSRGFAVGVRVRGTTFTPSDYFVALKVVQLATT